MELEEIEKLVDECKNRGGGLILNVGEKPGIVVLSVEKYNQLVSKSVDQQVSELGGQRDGQSANQQDKESPNQGDNQLENQPKSNVVEKKKRVLVTGGAGYIGCHAARKLLEEGYDVTILDNLSTGSLDNVPKGADFLEGDLADFNLLRDVFAAKDFFAVMHFAASVEVEESVQNPEKYLKNNCLNTANLLAAMAEANVKNIIFSSTAAVYESKDTPVKETDKLRPINPYGQSKLLAEGLVKFYAKNSGFSAIIFRYFNACGCDPSKPITPTHESHLLPLIVKAAKGILPHLTVFGSDYQTADGTCVRDYVHVLDIAAAHLLGLKNLGKVGCEVFNIGTGKGRSVLEMASAAAENLNRMVPLEMGDRRAGDPAILVADNSKIKSQLGFEAKYSDLAYIIKSAWKMV